ncbi:type IV pilus biogenesis protein PilP [Pseudomonas mosselii]|uniref:Type IV pilus biogenesis protein PilP n=1 Tax=Pseudomonas mosselii TaxID=78327 RepID=A0A7W2JZM4_9PSED|nr:type IV pilus biogenesis protein PilP [Pseudomonas mosselii]MBA6068114.1 type IV pilus biogenesis protein PilP [Pseudomonas mosselii]
MRTKPYALATVLTMVVAASNAAEAPVSTVGELSKVQSQTLMYEAMAKRAEAQGKFQQNNAAAGNDAAGPALSVTAVTTKEVPTVTGISGAAGRLYATFRYPNGTTVSAKSGDQIAGGFKVAEVGIDRVVITRGDRRLPLQFGVATEPKEEPLNGQAPFMPMQPGLMR